LSWEELGKTQVKIDPSQNAVQLSGSRMEIYGASINDRPAANTVPIGAMFNIVGTEKVWQSNGIDWVVL
jgi:hypothetical protein